MTPSIRKIVNEVEDYLDDTPWEVSEAKTGSGHIKVEHPNPDVSMVTVSATPGVSHYLHNLKKDVRRAEWEAGLRADSDISKKIGDGTEGDDSEETDSESFDLYCQYCDKGPFKDARGTAAHENSCEKNPDVWESCPGCGKPCRGPAALGKHKKTCPDFQAHEDTQSEEDTSPDLEPIKREDPADRRASIRSTLAELLREYERLRDDGRPLIEAADDLNEMLEIYTDLIIETPSEEKNS